MQQLPKQDLDQDHDGLTFEVVEEEHTEEGHRVRRKGIYLLPNLITTAALLCAFCSIIFSSNGKFIAAIYAIIVAALLDGIDGRVARAIGAQSSFGEQFDSLSDLLAFGAAPAILMYHWSLNGLGRIGLACCFVYLACAAFRLARFNVQIDVVDKRYFVGVASPLAACTIMSLVWLEITHKTWFTAYIEWQLIVHAIIMVIVGLTMVSNIKYYSFKGLGKKRVPFIVMLPIVLAFGLLIYDIPLGIFIFSFLYILSGIVMAVLSKNKSTRHI